MTMSKVDYQVIANLIVIAKEHNPEAIKGLNELSMMLCGAFGVNNPRFSTYLFLKGAEHYAANDYINNPITTKKGA
jgi:hypothetical protein